MNDAGLRRKFGMDAYLQRVGKMEQNAVAS
jgi:hypothetical protein